LADAASGPLNELLLRMCERFKTTDRRTIAALYAMRFGWASAMAIAPYLKYDCVPDISLPNVSLKFKESTFFERTAIHEPRGVFLAADRDGDALLRYLRDQLIAQANPVVETLYDWSGFARRGTWGMLTSSWAAHFITLSSSGVDQTGVLPLLRQFFDGADVVAAMQPRVHTVSYRDATHVYQRRASCCRFYLLPDGELCASCPLVSHDERLVRNLAWMKRQLDGNAASARHS
jgi:ferric iron reductase protein FhuF